ncbi:NAD(P)H:quinone oxidoreductase [Paenibacillus sp. GCM10023248]|uniref:NAD(P)H:quinone oxidoreductase n=1 Tax=Bacillales TaxID=1385 RepID=UPI002379EBA5|nr:MULTISPECIES: NAD(P)H:quinone oxidoreductase [Bacillales]MDD9269321.1 NAD(P)H:quinone oxidoreductase [Paenibacillus sp. MAHUQ-63]MDR6880455.1 NAD(P)H dehydrogenase (quinone) [Bacillus sp. 3255]
MANLLVIYYSAFGHVWQMAHAAADGAGRSGAHRVRIVRILEMASPANRVIRREKDEPANSAVLSRQFRLTDRYTKYEAAQSLQQHIPYATNDDLRWADGILWGFPTYYGSMPAQVKLFLELAGELCVEGALEGKPAGIFNSTASIHTGHEAAILTSMVPLFHFGMIFVGLPYSENPEYLTADAIGCSPYGASTLAGPDSSLTPDPRELVMAARLGERVADVAEALRLFRESGISGKTEEG